MVTWCKELTHWKRPWCWESLTAEGEGDDRGWDAWMASPTWWTWVFFFYFNWGLISLQYCGGFCHTFTWISCGCTCVPHSEPASPSHPSGSSQCTSPEHPVSTWVWVNSRSWWWTGRPGIVRFMGSKEWDTTEQLTWLKCHMCLFYVPGPCSQLSRVMWLIMANRYEQTGRVSFPGWSI